MKEKFDGFTFYKNAIGFAKKRKINVSLRNIFYFPIAVDKATNFVI